MAVKHITFQGVDREGFVARQRTWLRHSIEAGGLLSAWHAEHRGDARAVFTWESEDALRRFMEGTHDRALADAGTAGRSAVLYLTALEAHGTREGAAWVAESTAWIKEGGVDAYLASQHEWLAEMLRCDGALGATIARGRHAFVVTGFWRDAASHLHWIEHVVPELRSRTRGDEHVARLARFEGELVFELDYAK